ncbi:MAG TPA: tRNA lysidine(34) synthetase TilS [Tenacibaculum sp.]|nr:tRNA lysidine(34) synthetase TilS [Tenacibaculum sp.]
MEHKLLEHLNSEFPFIFGKKLVLAISGGIDSVVAAHLLKKIFNNLSLAHCNFQLRKEESDNDELFILELGKKLKIKTHTTKFDTFSYAVKKKTSTQIAARELRYKWFASLVDDFDYDYLVTAHHADDNLETFLINLTRGSGLNGLTGIPEKNDYIIRPFLLFSRDEIEDYASKNKISWREDSSNSEVKYLRNKFRHEIIPTLKKINPSLLRSFSNTITYLKDSQQIINDMTLKVTKKVSKKHGDILQIDIQKIKELPNPNIYLYQILQPYGFTKWSDVYKLINAENGKLIRTKSHTLQKDREFLLLLPLHKLNSPDKEYSIKRNSSNISVPVSLLFKNVQKMTYLDKNSIYVDKNLLNYPLTVRRYKTNDLIFPKGMKGRKKVSKYFKDEKLSLIEKQNTWLLCSSKDEVIWIIGMRQDQRFVPKKESTSILQILYINPCKLL